MNKIISREYFIENDTLWLAKDLLGKFIFTNTDQYGISGGMITETEAYMGITDKASHAYNDRRTRRTEVMYSRGGLAYVYLCYGMHHLFNIVTNTEGIPHAILIRAVKPVHGLQNISTRLRKSVPLHLNGPGKLTRAMGIDTSHTGTPLDKATIWLENRDFSFDDNRILKGPRIGVDYAGEDAKLPWRFWVPEASLPSLEDELKNY